MDPFLNEDVNLMNSFTLLESVRLQVRADAFNIANPHVFAQPFNLAPNPNSPASSTFGFLHE